MKKNFRKIGFLLSSLILTVYFFTKAIFSRETLDSGNKNFVISMTTFGWRYNFVFLTIESILSQTIKPSKIYLWIYHEDKPSILGKWFLDKQCKRGLVIKYVDENVRSYKKLSYILNETDCDFRCVVTADDDVFYPKDWLERFITHPLVYSNVLCNRGRVICFSPESDELEVYKKWPLANLADNVSNMILPTGVSGISYPINSLDERISDFDSISDLCPYADDIWYKLLTFSNGYKAIILNNNVSHYPLVITSLAKGLEKLNVENDYNTKQFISGMSYFRLKKSSFERE